MKKYTLISILLFIKFSIVAQNSADRDTGFNVSGLGTPVFATGAQYSKVTPLDNDKVLVTGSFYSAATTTPVYARILRLNSDGSFDDTFNVDGTGASGIVSATAVQTDGKIIIGGGFTSYNGTSINGIARLHSDGSLDTSFNPGTGFSSILPPPWVRSIAIQPDGKIVVGGGFTIFNGASIAGVCRLNSDGSLDNSFSPGSGPNNIVEAVALQSDGKIIAGGVFSSFNGVSTGRIARLNTNGSVDNTFTTATSGNILRLLIQPDGKILTSGANFYRLETNGSLDAGFVSQTLEGNPYSGLAMQNDGKIILTGNFTSYLSNSRQRIVRLHTDGTVDTEFDSQIGFSTNPNHIALQSNGKILVYGGLEYKGAPNLVTRIMGSSEPLSLMDTSTDTDKLKMFPNPACNYVILDITRTAIDFNTAIVSIIDIQGKIVIEKKMTNGITNLTLDNLQKGLYVVRIQSGNFQINKKLAVN